MDLSDVCSPVILPPGSGQVIQAFGDEVTIHLGGKETGGKFTMFTTVTMPGGGPPPHYHANEDEWFLPIEGRVEFYLDGVWNEVSPGTIAYMPKGTVHTFRNIAETPLRMLIHTAPAGFEVFFSRCAQEFSRPGPPNMQRIIEIAAEHGIFFVDG